jgi:hypothetical protein
MFRFTLRRLRLGYLRSRTRIAPSAKAYVELAQQIESKSVLSDAELAEVIDSYRKAIDIDVAAPSSAYRKLSAYLERAGDSKGAERARRMLEGRAKAHVASVKRAWRAINEPVPDEEQARAALHGIDRAALSNACATAKVRRINLAVAKSDELGYLASVGIKPEYVSANDAVRITENGVEDEDWKAKHPGRFHLHARAQRLMDRRLDALREGLMRAVCPFSGKVCATRVSFVVLGRVFYRFVSGDEVFFMIESGWGERQIYVPRLDALVERQYSSRGFEADATIIGGFKESLLADPHQAATYITIEGERPIHGVVGFADNIGHQLWNDLAGLYNVAQAGLAGKLARLILPMPEPYGPVERIMPEFAHTKLRHLSVGALGAYVRRKGAFAVRLEGAFIEEGMIERVIAYSKERAGVRVAASAAALKAKYPKLLWVTLRIGARAWQSQAEGYARMIKELSAEHPNLGFVINGYAVPERSHWPDYRAEASLAGERAAVARIKELVGPALQDRIVDIVGRPMTRCVMWALECHAYVSPWGASLYLPQAIAKLRGVTHSNSTVLQTGMPHAYSWERADMPRPTFLSPGDVHDTAKLAVEVSDNRFHLNAYEVDVDALISAVRTVL